MQIVATSADTVDVKVVKGHEEYDAPSGLLFEVEHVDIDELEKAVKRAKAAAAKIKDK